MINDRSWLLMGSWWSFIGRNQPDFENLPKIVYIELCNVFYMVRKLLNSTILGEDGVLILVSDTSIYLNYYRMYCCQHEMLFKKWRDFKYMPSFVYDEFEAENSQVDRT